MNSAKGSSPEDILARLRNIETEVHGMHLGLVEYLVNMAAVELENRLKDEKRQIYIGRSRIRHALAEAGV